MSIPFADGPSGSGRSDDSERRRKKKSRWAGGDHDKTFIPGMPTILPPGMSQDQQEAYLGESKTPHRQNPFLFSFRLTDLLLLDDRIDTGTSVYKDQHLRGNRFMISPTKSLEERNNDTCFFSQKINFNFKQAYTAFQIHQFQLPAATLFPVRF